MPLHHQIDNDEPQMSDAEIDRVAERVFMMWKAKIGDSTISAVKWIATVSVLAFLTWAGFIRTSHAAAIAFHINH